MHYFVRLNALHVEANWPIYKKSGPAQTRKIQTQSAFGDSTILVVQSQPDGIERNRLDPMALVGRNGKKITLRQRAFRTVFPFQNRTAPKQNDPLRPVLIIPFPGRRGTTMGKNALQAKTGCGDQLIENFWPTLRA